MNSIAKGIVFSVAFLLAIFCVIGMVLAVKAINVDNTQILYEKKEAFGTTRHTIELRKLEGKRARIIQFTIDYHEDVLKIRDYLYKAGDEVRLVEKLTDGKFTLTRIMSDFKPKRK